VFTIVFTWTILKINNCYFLFEQKTTHSLPLCVFKLCDLKIRISRSIILGVVLVYKRNPKDSKELIHVCCILFHHQYTVWNEKACSYTRLQLNPPYVYCLTSTQLIFHFAMQPAFLVPNKKMCIILQYEAISRAI